MSTDPQISENPAPGETADNAKKTLYIIDGHSQVFKAYHAIRQLSTRTGVPTNAIFGFVQILHRLLKSRKPTHLAVVFDSSGPTFRHEMYEAYKANRSAPPEDLSLQMEYIVKILTGMNLKMYRQSGFEADDIIATLARRAVAGGFDVRVITADKDLFQLVNDSVRIIRLEPNAETEFDREAVKTKMGVYPEQVGDLLAMMGDSSDNVPGIPHIGMKTAATLLEKFGDLDTILNSTDQLKGKQKEHIETGIDFARLSRKLVTLDFNVPVECNIEECILGTPDLASLTALYEELEFRKLAEELAESAPKGELPEAPPRETDYRAVTTLEELREFVAAIREKGFVALDVETDSLGVMSANLVGISLSVEPDTGVYIPVGHRDQLGAIDTEIRQLPLEDVRRELAPVLSDPGIRKFAHNLKFDWHMLRRNGMNIHPASFDSLLASYLINAERRGHGLKDLSRDLLNIKMTRIEDLIGSGRNQITFDKVPMADATPYAAADADVTLQLTQYLEPKMDSQARRLLDTIELPLVPVLMDMESEGIRIDENHFHALAIETNLALEQVRTKIFDLVGHEFNVGSPKQVANVLFEELKLRPTKSKKTGYSTDISVLEDLSSEHEVPALLAEYRQYEKLKGTYIDVLPTLVCPETGRIHTSYNQAVAATGRLSSSDPNLQNIPIRSEWGRKIRAGFIPSDPAKNVLLSADYSQIELRVLAHVTRDPALVKAYTEEEDIHALTASKVYGVDPEHVTSDMRAVAKMVNFGVIYGMSANGLSTRLKIPYATAKSFIDEYFRSYAGVRNWLDQTLVVARETGYVETLAGRRRYLPDLRSKNFNVRNAAERVAVNMPIQGSSADMIKIAMINMHKALQDSGLRTKMLLQVHDELVFDVPEDELDRVQPMIRDIMQNALPLVIPVKVEMGYGKNWNEVK